MITELSNCRVCGGTSLTEVVNLGRIFPSGFIKKGEDFPDENKVPLVAVKCDGCGLVQLKYTIDLDDMYRQYWYSSSLNKSMVSSLRDVVEDVEGKITLSTGDFVVDIGCNDGTMLQMFRGNINRVGFDPALNLHKPDCHTFINDYFTAEAYNKITDVKAKVVTAIAMFYDLPDPVGFTKDVASILDDAGIFVVQFTDLLSMFKLTAYDSFCGEHLEYYTLQDVINILDAAGLKIVDVSYNAVNGGSVRVTAIHKANIALPLNTVSEALSNEVDYFSNHDFDFFNKNIETTKSKVSGFLDWARITGNTVHLLGASTKGNTLLQHCGVSGDLVPFAAEVNPDKFGLRTLGSNIDIVSEDDSLIMHPNYYLVPVWHFKDNLLQNSKIKAYLESGGKLIFPLPEFTVVTNTGEFKI